MSRRREPQSVGVSNLDRLRCSASAAATEAPARAVRVLAAELQRASDQFDGVSLTLSQSARRGAVDGLQRLHHCVRVSTRRLAAGVRRLPPQQQTGSNAGARRRRDANW